VDAQQFWPHEALWPLGVTDGAMPGEYMLYRGELRPLPLEPGWYVVTPPDGARFVCPPRVFEATYEAVDEEKP